MGKIISIPKILHLLLNRIISKIIMIKSRKLFNQVSRVVDAHPGEDKMNRKEKVF